MEEVTTLFASDEALKIIERIYSGAELYENITGRKPTIFMSLDIASTIVHDLRNILNFTEYGTLTHIDQYEVKITRGTNELYVGYEIGEKKGE